MGIKDKSSVLKVKYRGVSRSIERGLGARSRNALDTLGRANFGLAALLEVAIAGLARGDVTAG